MFVFYFFVLYVPLHQFSLFRYAGMAATLGLFIWHYKDTLPLLRKCWPLLPYPILALLSISWSAYPNEARSAAILQMLMPILLITMAARLRPAEFLRVMMLAGLISALFCLPYWSRL
jgi:exopolysaccharide production protein ExoQ